LSSKEGLLVRIDDKLKRIKNGSLERDDEDVINDLIGYLILLKIIG
jgi:predicted RNA-binding protein associated with RNAse of E/G family